MVTQFGLPWNCPNGLYDDLPVLPADLDSILIKPSETITPKISSNQRRDGESGDWAIGGGEMGRDAGPKLLRFELGGISVAEIQYLVAFLFGPAVGIKRFG